VLYWECNLLGSASPGCAGLIAPGNSRSASDPELFGKVRPSNLADYRRQLDAELARKLKGSFVVEVHQLILITIAIGEGFVTDKRIRKINLN
jgi:hypothetical protein